jgi:hypothetical protein
MAYALHRLNLTQAQLQRNRRLQEALSGGIEEIQGITTPSLFYKEKNILRIAPPLVALEGGFTVESDLVCEKLSEALSVLVGILTIGSGLEERAREVKKRDGLTHAYAFESLALVALDMAAKEFFTGIEEDLEKRGRYLGVPLSPGETLGWNLEDQRTIYAMLEDEVEEITITDSHLLLPKNSASFVVGIYDYPVRREGETNCTYCSMRDRCAYKKR